MGNVVTPDKTNDVIPQVKIFSSHLFSKEKDPLRKVKLSWWESHQYCWVASSKEVVYINNPVHNQLKKL